MLEVVAAWGVKLHDAAFELQEAGPDRDGIRVEPDPASGTSAGSTQEFQPGDVPAGRDGVCSCTVLGTPRHAIL